MVGWLDETSRDSLRVRGVAWAFTVAVIAALGVIRTSTDAEFAFASVVIVPILFLSWVAGFSHGAVAAVLAAAMWVVTDLTSGLEFSATWIPVANGVTRLATYLLVASVTARVRKLMAREAARATRDPLTGLLNHRAFHDAGLAEVRRSRRYSHHLAVAFIDLDRFKALNDTRGHRAGDEALQATARALLRAVRETDVVARVGGDEFAVLFPQIGRDAARTAAQRLATALAAALADFSPAGSSIGVAWCDDSAPEFAELVRRADELMYEAKRQGQGVVFGHDFAPRPPPGLR